MPVRVSGPGSLICGPQGIRAISGADVITIDPSAAPETVKAWLDMVRPEIEADIERRLASQDPGSGRLLAAMRYAVLGPGKRLRPAMAMAACVAVGGDREAALPVASAVEMLHAYTLVHDDLPAMDDDDMRRGRPTAHVAFGEALAILAGDGLLTAAFGALADLGAAAPHAVAVLARRAGASELLSGQEIDLALAAEDARTSFAELERLHERKTGALFAASCELGGIAGNASAAERATLARYGMAFGVAFQHADDRDDKEHSEHADHAEKRMRELGAEAVELARSLGQRGHILLALATWLG